ncbi:dual specificity mitogen-activated protein kinase kinase 4 isoform X2 [Harmonia axyridis]|uniref:dual specificity mitogen-activated protein kinase kinase 4 isoform X2 n=1 Tax=Harmonia axyridis TaxID=115357 RepID=UPI001E2761CD|nr:dual specificity mitogen-activated protein kinase kinase 4 isoform X2 [Harmonia axyridis]
MADSQANQSNQNPGRRFVKMELNLPISSPQHQHNNFQFRPLPTTLGSTSTDIGFATSSNKPNMSLPSIQKTTKDPLQDKTRYRHKHKTKSKSSAAPPENIKPRDARFKICQNMHSTGKLTFDGVTYDFTSDDLQDMGEIGRGGFGTVNKMIHRKSGIVIAVKRIRSTVDEKEQKQLLMDLDVVMKSNECKYIVQFYGALFKEGDCWICMELMDTSLDKFYKFIYEKLRKRIPEAILGKIALATVKALNYLKEELKIIHRDVKPSNILLDKGGNIKLCDFGISGQLVDSIARTKDAGCRPYMAPERIDPQVGSKGYDVRSDVWSLGITLMEVATGRFPYPRWNSVFDQLHQVVNGEAPRLTNNSNHNSFTAEFVNFVNTCLIKDEHLRPKYNKLLQDPFILRSQKEVVDVAAYVSEIMDEMANNGISAYTTNQQF